MKLRFENFSIQFALALSAASALIYEVVATDILFFYFIRSSYSIATVLSVFLFGLGLGSFLIYKFLPKIKDKKFLFGILQIAIAIYSIFILSNLTEIIPAIFPLNTFAVSFILLLIPTTFLGAIFPLASSIFKSNKKDITGLVYSSDLFGAIIGSLIAGFVLIPFYGAGIAILFGAGLNLVSALIIFSRRQKLIPVLVLLFLFILNIIPIGVFVGENLRASKSYCQYYSPSPYGPVAVIDNTLFIDGRDQCSTEYPADTEERMLVVKALEPLKKQDKLEVLNIGLGCGLTLEKILEYNANADVVEINEKVVFANKVLTNVLENQNVDLIIDDGLNYLRKNSKKYDSVLIDVENPSVVHSSNLYTVEAFQIISSSLKENGTFSLFNYEHSKKYKDILYYSMKESFPFVYSYPGIFLASKKQLNETEFVPKTPFKINSITHNTLTQAYLDGENEYGLTPKQANLTLHQEFIDNCVKKS